MKPHPNCLARALVFHPGLLTKGLFGGGACKGLFFKAAPHHIPSAPPSSCVGQTWGVVTSGPLACCSCTGHRWPALLYGVLETRSQVSVKCQEAKLALI